MNRRAEILSSFSEPLAVASDLALAMAEFANDETAQDFPILTREMARTEQEAQARFFSMVPIPSDQANGLNGDLQQAQVAVIQIEGLISDSYWYGTSEWYCRLIRNAASDPNCSAIVLRMNSYGGSPQGAERMAECIAEVDKPVVCLVDKFALSGAYWVACACDAIYIAGETARVGSIGVMSTITLAPKKEDPSQFRYITLYANTSSKKNEDIRAVANGDNSKMIDRLNKLDSIFMAAVKASRGDKLDIKNTLDGQDYLAADAIKYGLADGQCCLEDCIAMAPTVAKKNADESSTTSKEDMGIFGSSLPKDITVLVGADASAVSEAQLDSANAALAGLGVAGFEIVRQSDAAALVDENKTLNTEKAQLTTQVAQLTAELATAQQELATAKNKIAELGGKPAAAPANPASSDAAEGGAKQQITFNCEADRIAYEKTGINPSTLKADA